MARFVGSRSQKIGKHTDRRNDNGSQMRGFDKAKRSGIYMQIRNHTRHKYSTRSESEGGGVGDELKDCISTASNSPTRRRRQGAAAPARIIFLLNGHSVSGVLATWTTRARDGVAIPVGGARVEIGR